MPNTTKHSTKGRKQDNRGSNEDVAARLSNLSIRQIDGVAVNGRPFTVGKVISHDVPIQVKRMGIRADGSKGLVRVPGQTGPKRFREFNGCHYCGAMITCDPSERQNITVRAEQDRIIPGGKYKLDNLRLACRDCNNRRSDNEDWQPDPWQG